MHKQCGAWTDGQEEAISMSYSSAFNSDGGRAATYIPCKDSTCIYRPY